MPMSNSHSPAIMLLISAKDWCVAQGEVTVSHFLELKVNSLQTLATTLFASRLSWLLTIKPYLASGFSSLIVRKVCVLHISNSLGVLGLEYGYMLFIDRQEVVVSVLFAY